MNHDKAHYKVRATTREPERPRPAQVYCPKCKRFTDHALVVSFGVGHAAKAWRCLVCGQEYG